MGRQRTTGSIYLNDWAYWRNVPANLWSYKLEATRCSRSGCRTASARCWGRSLRPEEVQHFAEMGRRVGRMLGLVGGVKVMSFICCPTEIL